MSRRRVRALRGDAGQGVSIHVPHEDGPKTGSELDVAVVLDLLEVACAAGASVPGALAAVGRATGGARGRLLERAGAALVLGATWEEAWSGADRGPEAALTPVAVALRPSWDDGASPAGALRAAAQVLRRERRGQALEAAGRLGVRLVLPLGLCHLPAFVLTGLVPVLISVGTGALSG